MRYRTLKIHLINSTKTPINYSNNENANITSIKSVLKNLQTLKNSFAKIAEYNDENNEFLPFFITSNTNQNFKTKWNIIPLIETTSNKNESFKLLQESQTLSSIFNNLSDSKNTMAVLNVN